MMSEEFGQAISSAPEAKTSKQTWEAAWKRLLVDA
jgi:hypothetical protein